KAAISWQDGVVHPPSLPRGRYVSPARVVRHLQPRRSAAAAANPRPRRDLGLRFRMRAFTPTVTSLLSLRESCAATSAVGKLRHVAGFDFSNSAYWEARQRLPSTRLILEPQTRNRLPTRSLPGDNDTHRRTAAPPNPIGRALRGLVQQEFIPRAPL